MDLGIEGKSAIVCGASQGLGRACAEVLAGEGVKMVMCSRNFDRIFNTARSISETYGVQTVPIAADLSLPESPDKLVREAVAKFRGVDILINNVGGPPPGRFEDLSDEEWEKAFHLTLMSAVRMTRAVLPVMIENKWGRIVNLASIAVKQPIAGLMLSNSLRSAVVGMAKSLSAQTASKNVLINTIATGSFATERLESLFKSQQSKMGITVNEARAKLESTIPLGRVGRPEELAWLAAFLASERASYITGATIQVDGGAYSGMM
ncbi:MAG: SDR family oxidoreductase [Candidatus Latescibacteria bacterium]|jgi:3-oxoacyl-[acyl-carrier protein] reductase|nr:SDR family oxidoreductase [Candidatus Latescibacterota bacterium]